MNMFNNLMLSFFMCIGCMILVPKNGNAQSKGEIHGVVMDAQTKEPVAAANVFIPEINRGTATNAQGEFTLAKISTGTYTVEFSFLGYRKNRKTLTVKSGRNQEITVLLSPSQLNMQGITVTSLRPDLKADAEMKQAEIRKANPRDSGELLRNVSGVDAVRRGPVGLDPVVRGLRETEIGTYLDGTRIFPAGPARMDSPLSHLDPSSIEKIEVVKGPYALNWGAGNMGAIKVQTKSLQSLQKSLGGKVSSGYDSNFNTFEEAASVYGKSHKFGYLVSGAWRTGSDYTSGNGTKIPGDYLSREIRGKLSYANSQKSRLTLSLGYQNQEDIDYPGRLLDASYFNTYNASLEWKWNAAGNLVRNLEARLYLNNVSHGMDNDEKPTAKPDANRMPPFGLDVTVDADNHVYGGKLAATMATSEDWNWEIGSDVYSSYRNATRSIARRDNGQQLFFDLMWPEATITDVGIYNRLSHVLSDKFSATASVRLDIVSADADTISQFFKDRVSTDLKANEANVSASGTISYLLSDYWTLGLGLGTVVRTADASERYADRIPASKAQTSAEFVGNPDLKPERSTQADLWLEAAYERFSISINAFVRSLDHYITLKPTNLPKRLPLSPATVYQYINGTAQFTGFDITSRYKLAQPLTVDAGLSYLWAQDTKVDEPALGIPPLTGTLGLQYHFQYLPAYVGGTFKWVNDQDRVAATRGETATKGYSLLDLEGAWEITHYISLQLGVKNVLDTQYVNHLNAKNPYTGLQVAEPGRVMFADISIKF